MAIADRLHHYMQRKGVHFDVVAHAPTMTSSATAQAAHIPGVRVAKPVVIHHEMGFLVAVVPSTHRVELSTLQELLDRRLGLATEAEITTLFTDCQLGAIPPIGAAYGVPVMLDDSLADATDLYFEGGDHTSLIHVSGQAFRMLTNDARHGRFSHPA